MNHDVYARELIVRLPRTISSSPPEISYHTVLPAASASRD
jgi:hypothetical protein